MTTVTAEKSSLQSFLEEVRALLRSNMSGVHPADLHMLLSSHQRGMTPADAAAAFVACHTATNLRNSDAYIADIKDALRNHAFSVEQQVQLLSNQIAASTQANGGVDGLLYFSHNAQELPALGARLTVYREFLTLLHIVHEALDADKAVSMARSEAVSRLINLREGGESGERAGAADALKKVIKILDNAL